mmetsp:Transcript_21580/g.64603  ORF Transcript_21580/g.64603 Transcript_21580/m.64603 type:complete len:453 (-) Transcript_21580:60-1418(-)
MIAASFMRFWSCAPEKPMVRAAISPRSTSSARGLLRQCTRRMATRPSLSGRSTGTRRSKRPGRRSAESRMSPRFVAASTMTPELPEKPSISVRIWLSVCSRSSFVAKPPPPERWRPMASISSMKMMQGAFFLASAKSERMREAPTPTNISTNSEPEQEMKGTPASPATARARSVLPVPGGPSRSTPRGDWAPTLVNLSGLERKSTTSSSSSLEASQPATSSKVTPVLGSIWILDLGWSMPMGPPGPPMPPMPPPWPPRRPRKKRPPSSTRGKRRLAARPARALPSSEGAACTANGTLRLRSCFTRSGTSEGRISTAWRAPSPSRANSSLESAEKTTRSTPSFWTTSRNSETAQRAPSAARAGADETASAVPEASAAANARRPWGALALMTTVEALGWARTRGAGMRSARALAWPQRRSAARAAALDCCGMVFFAGRVIARLWRVLCCAASWV